MEGLPNAEKKAEQIIKGIQTVADQKITQLEKYTVVKQQIISVRSEPPTELTETLKQAENNASQRLSDYNKVEKNRGSSSEINKLNESNCSKIPETQENVEEVNLEDHDVNSQDKYAKETIFSSTNLDLLVSDTDTAVSGFSFGATLQSKSKLIENTTAAFSVCTTTTPSFEITDFNSKNDIAKGTTNSGNYYSTVSLPVTSNFGASVQSKSSSVGNTTSSTSIFTPATSASAITKFNSKDGSTKGTTTDCGNCNSIVSIPVTSNSVFSLYVPVQSKSSLVENRTTSSSIFTPASSASAIADLNSKNVIPKEITDCGNRDSIISLPVTPSSGFNFCSPVQSKSNSVGITTSSTSIFTSATSVSSVTDFNSKNAIAEGSTDTRNCDSIVSVPVITNSAFSFCASEQNNSSLYGSTTPSSSNFAPATSDSAVTDFKNGISEGITDSENRDSMVSVPVTSNFASSFDASVQNKSSLVGNTNPCSSIFAPATSASAIADINFKDVSAKDTADNGNCDSTVSVPVTSNSGFSFDAPVHSKSSLVRNTNTCSSFFAPGTPASSITAINAKDGSSKETTDSGNCDSLVSVPVTSSSGFSFVPTLQEKTSVIGNTTPNSSIFLLTSAITNINSKDGFAKETTDNVNRDSLVSVPVTSSTSFNFGAPVQNKSNLVGNTNTYSSIFAPGTPASAITDINSKDGSSKETTDSGNCDSLVSVPDNLNFDCSSGSTLQKKPSLIGNTSPSSSVFLSASAITDINSKDGFAKGTTNNVNRDSLVFVPVTSISSFFNFGAPAEINFSAPVQSKSGLVRKTKLYPRIILNRKERTLSPLTSAPSTTSMPLTFQTNIFGNCLENSILPNFNFSSVTQSNLNKNRITTHDSSLFSSVSSTSNLNCSMPTITGTTTPTGTTIKFNARTGSDIIMKDGVSTSIGIRLQCITCMKEYETKSLEELREEDYADGRHGKPAKEITFGEITQTNFGSIIPQTAVFGTSPFASTHSLNFAAVKKIQEDFMNLLVSEEDSDVTIKVQGKEIRAHKAILRTRSTVFKSMFSHQMIENERGSVTIDDIDFSTFQNFLRFVYTGGIEYITQKNVCSLYKASDKYDVQELKKACLMFMEKELSVGLFCDAMSLALLHNEKNLKELAIKFFCRNALEIIETPSWISFLDSNSIAGNELFIKALSMPCQYCNQIKPRKRGAAETD